MMAMSAFTIGRREDWYTPVAPMIPSLVHPYLWAKLRDEWGSDCFAQTDCCDSINTMVGDHHYFPDIRSAVLAAVEMGLQASYGPDGDIDAALTEMLGDGSLDMELFDARIARTLLTRFRLGEFDIGRNPEFPYAGPYNESLLDGPANRQLAREAAAASVVLLKNEGKLLPLALGAGKTLAVIGPFANCTVIDGGYGAPERDDPLACSYLHSYSGFASAVSTIVDQAIVEGAGAGFRVVYAQGSNLVSAFNGSGGVAAAVAAAQSADIVLLVVGLSSYIEAEGNDRANVTLPKAQQDLVDAVTAVVPASKLVLVVVAAGSVDTSYESAGAAIHYNCKNANLFSVFSNPANPLTRPPLATSPRTSADPGEEAGTGLFDVLTGRLSPSGRMPVTVYRHEYLDVIEPLHVFAMVCESGAGRTYRFSNYVADPTAPSLVRWYFGHGLSFAGFTYSALSLAPVSPAPGPGAPPEAGLVTLSVSVQNTGAVRASEIVQIYVAVPRDAAANSSLGGAPIPLLGLQWFTKVVDMAPGAPATVLTTTLSVNAFRSTTIEGGRVVTGGLYTVYASGHMPFDTTDGAGVAGSSNVVSATIELPVMGASREGARAPAPNAAR